MYLKGYTREKKWTFATYCALQAALFMKIMYKILLLP
jgi:hypothetical protein